MQGQKRQRKDQNLACFAWTFKRIQWTRNSNKDSHLNFVTVYYSSKGVLSALRLFSPRILFAQYTTCIFHAGTDR